jgi:hypothetical protein
MIIDDLNLGFFKRNEEVIFAVTNLGVFIFIMTAIVYETQKLRNPQIHNYADALYFTVTALTVSLPDLRPATARRRCRPLQGLRDGSEDPG